MPTGTWVLLVVVAMTAAFFILSKRRSSGHLQQISDRRRSSSRIVGRGAYMESGGRINVALALSDSMFYYENDDLQASLELERVDEVEYDTELSTGMNISDGKVMRLRSHSRLFEFVLPTSDAPRWESTFPAHQNSQGVKP